MKIREHVAIFASSVLIFSACMLWLPFERANAFDELTHRAMKATVYTSGMGFVAEAVNLMRLIEGRPSDKAFTVEMVKALGLYTLILFLSESGLIAAGF